MGFGQVASVMSTMTIVYAIVLSYQDYLLKLKLKLESSSEDGNLTEKDMEMAFVTL